MQTLACGNDAGNDKCIAPAPTTANNPITAHRRHRLTAQNTDRAANIATPYIISPGNCHAKTIPATNAASNGNNGADGNIGLPTSKRHQGLITTLTASDPVPIMQ